MTLPSGGTISISNVSTEIGQSATYSTSLGFLNGLIKASQRPSTPNMTGFYSKAYYQKTNDGNCDNGNCTSNCNCGNIQCTNCYISGPVNCVNCDTQAWLQTNCNCACTYNCATGQVSYNCNCDCGCCVVASALNASGVWGYDKVLEITEWATKHLDTFWIGERVHRGYHIIGPKVIIPMLRKRGILGKYVEWGFGNAISMLQGKRFDPLAGINSIPWIIAMFIVGLCVTKRYAKATWLGLQRSEV